MPVVVRVPLERLRTSHARLRASSSISATTRPSTQANTLASLPLRAVPMSDGTYEVVDGFKQLAAQRAAGATHAEVLVEAACPAADQKLLLLAANAPPRTLRHTDEVRVVASLVDDDGLTLLHAARRAGKKTRWAAHRLTLARSLSPRGQRALDAGEIGLSLGLALCALPERLQSAALDSAARHQLTRGELERLVAALRAAETDAERDRILREPVPVVRPVRQAVCPLGALGTRVAERLARARDALTDLASLRVPEQGLGDAERRRLEAEHRRVLALLHDTARALSPPHDHDEESHERRRPDDPALPDADAGHAVDDAPPTDGGTTDRGTTGDRPADPGAGGPLAAAPPHDGGHGRAAVPGARPRPDARGGGEDPRVAHEGLRDAPHRDGGGPRPQARAPDPRRSGLRPR